MCEQYTYEYDEETDRWECSSCGLTVYPSPVAKAGIEAARAALKQGKKKP